VEEERECPPVEKEKVKRKMCKGKVGPVESCDVFPEDLKR